MSLINELRAKSYDAENTKQEVIAEIKKYFDEYLAGDELENYLRYKIQDDEIKDKQVMLCVQFWEHHDGCSTTHFSCGGKWWYNPENKEGYHSYKYKGVALRTIDKDVCNYVSTKLIIKMEELGFKFLSSKDCRGRLDYYDKNFYFGW